MNPEQHARGRRRLTRPIAWERAEVGAFVAAGFLAGFGLALLIMR